MQINLLMVAVTLISSPVFAQYEVRPDVTFGDHNDRFDVSDLMSYQNQYLRSDGSVDYRRRHATKKQKLLRNGLDQNNQWRFSTEKGRKKFARKVKKETEQQLNQLANIILMGMQPARRDNEYAYHDNMEDNGGTVNDFYVNLAKFERAPDKVVDELNSGYRRVGAADMFNYAFPIDMKVQGYLVPPENSQ